VRAGHLGAQDGTQGGGEYWRFGVAGASRLTILAEADGFLVCVHDGFWVMPGAGAG